MITLDDYPANDAVTGRTGRLMEAWQRWLTRLLQLVRMSVVTLGGVSRRTTGSIGATWLQSSVPLPAGLYRLTVAARTVAGVGTTAVDVLFDDGGLGATETVPVVTTTTGLTTGTVVRRLQARSRVGYQVAVSGSHETDLELVVEALPAATRLA